MRISNKKARWMILRMAAMLACCVVLAYAPAGSALAALSADALMEKWRVDYGFAPQVQDFSQDKTVQVPCPELVTVSECAALKTAIESVCIIEGITPDALVGYVPTLQFKAIGTEYSYDVRFVPAEASPAMSPYYLEIGASFAGNMLRYHVLSEDGTQTEAIKFFSGEAKEIKALDWATYQAQTAGG